MILLPCCIAQYVAETRFLRLSCFVLTLLLEMDRISGIFFTDLCIKRPDIKIIVCSNSDTWPPNVRSIPYIFPLFPIPKISPLAFRFRISIRLGSRIWNLSQDVDIDLLYQNPFISLIFMRDPYSRDESHVKSLITSPNRIWVKYSLIVMVQVEPFFLN